MFFVNGSSGLTALEALRGRGSGERAGGPSAEAQAGKDRRPRCV